MPKGVTVQLRLRAFCTSAERLAWAKANGCPWGVVGGYGLTNPCALAAEGGHLEALQWARQHPLRVGRSHVLRRRSGRAPANAAVGAGARLPVG